MRRFYEGWDTSKYGTSEEQPGIYGDLDIPSPAGSSSIPSNFVQHSMEEQAEGYIQVPTDETPDRGFTPEYDLDPEDVFEQSSFYDE